MATGKVMTGMDSPIKVLRADFRNFYSVGEDSVRRSQ
jgi:hypothetical protein